MTKSFDDYYEENKAQNAPHPLHSAWVGATTGIDDAVAGLVQTAGEALGMRSFLVGLDRYRKKKHAEYEYHAKANPWSTRGSYVGGIVTGSAPLGIAAASNPATAGQAIGRGLSVGLLSGLTSYGTPAERLQSGGIGSLLGVAIPAAGRAVGKGVSALRGQSSAGMRNQVVRDVAENLKSTGKVGASLNQFDDAAKAGVHLTPEQAAYGDIMGNITKGIPKDKATQRAINKFLASTDKKGKNILLSELNKLAPDGVEEASKTASMLYDKVANVQAPSEFLQKFSNNPIYKLGLNDLRGNKRLSAFWGMDETSPNTIGETQKVLAYLRELKKGEGGIDSGNLKSFLTEAKKLTHKNTDYKQADALYTQVKAFSDYDDALKKAIAKPGEDILTGSFDDLYNKVFKTVGQQEGFLGTLKAMGGDPEHSKKVIQLLNNMRNNPMGKVVGKKVGDAMVEEVPSIGARALNMFTRFKQGRYNKQILDVYMDPKWKSKVESVLQNKDPVKQASGMLDLLETSGSVAATVGTAAEDTKAMLQGKPMVELPGAPKEMSSQNQVGTQSAPSKAPAAPGQSDFEKALGGESYIHPAKKDATITEVPMDQRDMRLSQDFSASYPRQAIQKTMSQRGVNMDHPAVQLANRIPVPNPQDYDNDNQYINAVNDYYNEYTSVAYEIYDAPHVPLNPDNRL